MNEGVIEQGESTMSEEKEVEDWSKKEKEQGIKLEKKKS